MRREFIDYVAEENLHAGVKKLVSKYKKKKTDDYQKRGGNYPSGGIPDSIAVGGWQNEFFMDYSFKNTSEREAIKWVTRDLGSAARQFKITAGQDGDYKDDWVTVYVQKVFE